MIAKILMYSQHNYYVRCSEEQMHDFNFISIIDDFGLTLCFHWFKQWIQCIRTIRLTLKNPPQTFQLKWQLLFTSLHTFTVYWVMICRFRRKKKHTIRSSFFDLWFFFSIQHTILSEQFFFSSHFCVASYVFVCAQYTTSSSNNRQIQMSNKENSHTCSLDLMCMYCVHAKHSMFWCDFETNVVSDGAAHIWLELICGVIHAIEMSMGETWLILQKVLRHLTHIV